MIVVDLVAGPGAGKSTLAAHVYALLKWDGQSVELATEFAKELTWERRDVALSDHLYILAKQAHRLHRLDGQVGAVVTDSPLVLSLRYGRTLPGAFRDLIWATWQRYVHMVYFVDRVKPFEPEGRREDEAAARVIDAELLALLEQEHVRYRRVPGVPIAAHLIASHVRARLQGRTESEALPLADVCLEGL